MGATAWIDRHGVGLRRLFSVMLFAALTIAAGGCGGGGGGQGPGAGGGGVAELTACFIDPDGFMHADVHFDGDDSAVGPQQAIVNFKLEDGSIEVASAENFLGQDANAVSDPPDGPFECEITEVVSDEHGGEMLEGSGPTMPEGEGSPVELYE